MERLWQRCIFDYLRAEPEDHYVLLVRALCFTGCSVCMPILDCARACTFADGATAEHARGLTVACGLVRRATLHSRRSLDSVAQENREYTAEVMFETYNVPGLYIAVQAVLALAASWTSKKVCLPAPFCASHTFIIICVMCCVCGGVSMCAGV